MLFGHKISTSTPSSTHSDANFILNPTVADTLKKCNSFVNINWTQNPHLNTSVY